MDHNTTDLPGCAAYIRRRQQHRAGAGLSSEALAAAQKWPGGLTAMVEAATKTQHGLLHFLYNPVVLPTVTLKPAGFLTDVSHKRPR